MTIDQAIALAKQGKKISHKLFIPGEYVYYDTAGQLTDELGIKLTHLFWDHRKDAVWQNDWKLF